MFNTSDFLLKCPETYIDKFIKMLSIKGEDCVFLETDVSKVFNNIRMAQADALKFIIDWIDKSIDVAIIFT